MNIKQKTIKTPVSFRGIGLHTGRAVTLKLYPAPENTGIVYRRVDLDPVVYFYPNPSTVRGTQLSTQIFSEDQKHFISTVEHLNAALSAYGIDNLIIDLDNVEVPIGDGSSIVFCILLEEAGIVEQQANKKFLRVTKPVEVKLEDKWVKIDPYLGFKVDFTIDFSHPFISSTNQRWAGEITAKVFKEQLSRARTFGFMKDIEYLQTQGMCLGGSLDNAIVLDEYRMLNQKELHYPDEFVRHKVLDVVGDLFVYGKNILGAYSAFKSGHQLNNLALQEILKEGCSEIITFEDEKEFKEFSLDNLHQLNEVTLLHV